VIVRYCCAREQTLYVVGHSLACHSGWEAPPSDTAMRGCDSDDNGGEMAETRPGTQLSAVVHGYAGYGVLQHSPIPSFGTLMRSLKVQCGWCMPVPTLNLPHA
jgi:hypothetical protein